MVWGLTKIQCKCNGTQGMATQVQQCVPAKQVLPVCTPVITATMRSACGARRMFVSAIILIFLLAAIYWISLPPQQANPGPHRPIRNQPSQHSRNPEPERTETDEITRSE